MYKSLGMFGNCMLAVYKRVSKSAVSFSVKLNQYPKAKYKRLVNPAKTFG